MINYEGGVGMGVFIELFTSFEGLLSLAVVIFMIGMAGYCAHMFISKMNSEGVEKGKRKRKRKATKSS
jgi:hypothetical protein